jgi:hypothetical protein
MRDRLIDNGRGGREETAAYVAGISSELAAVARKSGLDTLGFLLDMVRLEAEMMTRSKDVPN